MKALILSMLFGIQSPIFTISLINNYNHVKQEKIITLENTSDFPLFVGSKAFNCEAFSNYKNIYSVKCRNRRTKESMSATGVVKDTQPLYLEFGHYSIMVLAK